MSQNLKDVELRAELALGAAKRAWEKNFGRIVTSPYVVAAAKVRGIDKMAAVILKYWLEKGGPSDLEALKEAKNSEEEKGKEQK